MLEAVGEKKSSPMHTTLGHKADREIVLEAMKQNECVLQHAAPEQRDCDDMLEAVKQSRGAASEHEADRESVLEAVNLNGDALGPPLEALKQKGFALNQEAIPEVVKQNGKPLSIGRRRRLIRSAVAAFSGGVAVERPRLLQFARL